MKLILQVSPETIRSLDQVMDRSRYRTRSELVRHILADWVEARGGKAGEITAPVVTEVGVCEACANNCHDLCLGCACKTGEHVRRK